MKALLIHKDGRLRTGYVAILAFLLILGLMAAVFEYREPVDRVLLVVKEVFYFNCKILFG